jgi:uncharacterized membrane protein
MKQLLLYVSILVASGLLFANVYTSLVDARSWGSDLPQSIATARAYFNTINPGDFFRIFSPANQVIALACLILFWKTSRAVRIALAAALILYVVGDVMTFAYFYPRNDILFKTADLSDVELLRKTWSQWSTMNWVRSAVILAGLGCSCAALHRSYRGPTAPSAA